MIRTIVCFCEHDVEVDVPGTLELTDEIKRSILDGTFMSITCQWCKRELKPELETTFILPDKQQNLLFVPESDRSKVLSGGEERSDLFRIVIGYQELVEKIKLMENNLEDQVIELIKYRYLEKAPPESDIEIYFQKTDNQELEFYIYGLREDEVGVARIGYETYEAVKKSLPRYTSEEPFSVFLTPPYVSIKQISLEP